MARDRDPPPRVLGARLAAPVDAETRRLHAELQELRQQNAALRERPAPATPRAQPQVQRHTSLPPSSGISKAAPPWWVTLAIAVATALAGAGGGQLVTPKPTDPTPQLTAVRDEISAVRDDVREIRDRLRKKAAADADRWEISSGLLCRLNAGGPTERPRPFARGVDCDAVTWETPPLGNAVPWRSTAEWPRAEKAP